MRQILGKSDILRVEELKEVSEGYEWKIEEKPRKIGNRPSKKKSFNIK